MEMKEKVEKYIKEKGMLTECRHIVMGLSGGADSVCLFHVLYKLLPKYDIGLTAVHIHHGIRGSEADRDLQYCKKMCKKFNVEFIEFHYDVPQYAEKHGLTCEEAGRILRYSTFEKIASNYQACKIAVAHHMNDQAETVLFNMCRGSGLKGMRGMLPVNGDILRPLLCCTRKEIEEYIIENNLSYCTDSTNLLGDYSRNQLRIKVVPYLEDNINPAVVKNISGMADKISEAEEYLQKVTEKAVEECIQQEDNGYMIYGLEKYDRYIAKRVIIAAIGMAATGLKDITDKHIADTVMLMDASAGTSIDIRKDIRSKKEQDGIYIYNPERKHKISPVEIKIPSEITTDDGGETLIFELIDWGKNQKILNDTYTKFFDYDKIKGNLLLRTRKTGDYMTIDDFGHHKKIKELFVDEKIPGRKRDRILLLADGDHIMWIMGGRISSAYKIDKATTRVLKVTYGGHDNGKS